MSRQKYSPKDHGNILAHNSQAQTSEEQLNRSFPGRTRSSDPLPPIYPRAKHDTDAWHSASTPEDSSITARKTGYRPTHSSGARYIDSSPLINSSSAVVSAQDPMRDDQLRTLYERLADNERRQQATSMETSRLHGELNEAFRTHESVLKDEVQMRR